VATGEWSTLDDGQTFNLVIDKHEKQIADFVNDDTQYTIGISLKEFPSFQEMQTINLPPGIHRGNSIRFTEDNKHVLAEFRTYERKNIWNKWKTTIVCIELETGNIVGQYHFPVDNDSPILASAQMSDGTVVFHSWRESPKRIFGLSFPELEKKWETELGDYSYVRPGIVSSDQNWVAFICNTKSKAMENEPIDWDLVPQNDLKIISKEGKLLESMVLPVGAASMTFSPDGKTAVIGALGSVYKVDVSQPFELR